VKLGYLISASAGIVLALFYLSITQRTNSTQINRIYFGTKSVTPNVGTYRGAFVILSNGQEDLNNIDLTNRGLNKEIWLTLDDGKDSNAQCWLEAGQTKAKILNDSSVANDPASPVTYNPQYKSHSGHFVGVAYVNTSLYNEFRAIPIGTQNPTGEHSYQIQPVAMGSSNWEVRIDGQLVYTTAAFRCIDKNIQVYYPTSSSRIDTGLEIKDSSVSFKSGTMIRNLKYLDANNTWRPINPATVSSIDSNPVVGNTAVVNGKSTFSSTPDARVTFTR
jgi:hypothetical protein